MKNVQFWYLKDTQLKVFSTKKKFLEWARDEAHDGKYSIAYSNMTNIFTRKKILEVIK